MKSLHMVAFILLVIGGLNWLLTVFNWGVGNWLPDMAENVIYVVIGLAAIYEIVTHKQNCRNCTSGSGMGGQTM